MNDIARKKRQTGIRTKINNARLDSYVGFLLRKAHQRNLSLFQQFSLHPEITSVQTAALLILNEKSPSSLTELGRGAAMDPATTRGVVERLRDRGYVLVASDPRDRRQVLVRPSRKGAALINDLIKGSQIISEATLASLTAAERTTFLTLLRKVCANGVH